jgi:protein phosphatase
MVTIQAGDRFLLCTDGLYGVVPDDQLAQEISKAQDMQQCADHLGELALAQGSRDNVSCIVFEVLEG